MARNDLSAEEIEAVVRLYASGISATAVGSQTGRSRNSVIGIIHRHAAHLKRGGAAPKPKTPKKPPLNAVGRGVGGMIKARVEAVRAYVAPVPPVVPSPATKCTLMELQAGMCKWPLGDPGTPDFGFCGSTGDMHPNGVYCRHHARLAYQVRAN